jgi:hypothetical protein
MYTSDGVWENESRGLSHDEEEGSHLKDGYREIISLSELT